MKTFIIATLTADGFIAKDAIHSPMGWSSKADKKRFVELTKAAGVIVMGSSTYKTIGRPLPDRVNIVYSRSGTFPGVEMTNLPPRELLKSLEDRGFKNVAICGGAHIYSMFMKAGVVDKLYLTIEPHLFGKGITLFNEEMNNHHLVLKNVLQSESSGTLFLEYDVDYSGNPKMTE